MNNYLLNLANKRDGIKANGIYSVCSSNEYVLKASIVKAKKDGSFLLVEPTANQVNQYGGYTGRTPQEFVDYITKLVREVNFPIDKLILGGDHLGPNPWKSDPAEEAMEKSRELVRAYVKAGFTKIHLDTSIPCANDDVKPGVPMDDEIVAKRSAELCKVAEETFQETNQDSIKPVYIIGTEVPIPGGAEGSIHDIEVTSVESAKKTIDITKKAFLDKGLDDAWNRVIAQVVQPGVEFGNNDIVPYDPKEASDLSSFIKSHDGMMFEAHSTDYQTYSSLKGLVQDGFRILKVGPWLTFSFREAIFALAHIERELLSQNESVELSNIRSVLERVMVENPESWEDHYEGDNDKLKYLRKYSYSDRSRYYWPNTSVKKALEKLFKNLEDQNIPLPLLSQYLPSQYEAIKKGDLSNDPNDIVLHKIQKVIGIYAHATNQA
ncbi:D-tagatose-bisphosphate aldolase, class II, non-catalytic subunit [Fodinibius sp. SL11]|uniref:D-tagatose-bisphosphate aldolase, class II, non-catalytic subunit n=1 Tax=Fodinibius sp. SL11 TaxID=3425690 RepID=UPI003F8852AA